ncbi:adenylyltransferase/cytidyltransferase family protein [Streptomyces sp. BI20]|uniref:adenylyltransferase/cytidyltransferase family protein n=1 Tax=Streptomyces sp. BI20 TaxID=3403460 RepID=UPI003C76F128
MSHIIGYAPGVFDLFHIGHLNLLKSARAQCDHLVVGVLTDTAAEHKGHRPAVPLEERLEIVRSMRYADTVVVDHSLDKMQAWQQVGFHRLFKGDDWQGTDLASRWETDFATVGVDVVYLPYTGHVSSTRIREMLTPLGTA